MKTEYFDKYVDDVCRIFRINKRTLFSKTKKHHASRARQFLIYLCSLRKIPNVYIQTLLSKEGYDVGHSTIIYSIRNVRGRVKADKDYDKIIDSGLNMPTTDDLA